MYICTLGLKACQIQIYILYLPRCLCMLIFYVDIFHIEYMNTTNKNEPSLRYKCISPRVAYAIVTHKRKSLNVYLRELAFY